MMCMALGQIFLVNILRTLACRNKHQAQICQGAWFRDLMDHTHRTVLTWFSEHKPLCQTIQTACKHQSCLTRHDPKPSTKDLCLSASTFTINYLPDIYRKLPCDWKDAYYAPIFKKGQVHLTEYYKPVSLTCVTRSFLRTSYINTSNFNHGFRTWYSCKTKMPTTLHDLSNQRWFWYTHWHAVLDFSKAFDTIPYRKLQQNQYGVTDSINLWLTDFLIVMNIKFVGEESKPAAVDSGVSQGPAIGPLLFLCHTNDLPDSVSPTSFYLQTIAYSTA